jgi:hypothetical protein
MRLVDVKKAGMNILYRQKVQFDTGDQVRIRKARQLAQLSLGNVFGNQTHDDIRQPADHSGEDNLLYQGAYTKSISKHIFGTCSWAKH